MPNPVSACLIIDTSASMSQYGYVSNTVIDSKAFVSYALPQDAIAVINYSTNAAIAYGPNGQMAVVDASYSQVSNAVTAIQNLVFNGNATNIGGGIIGAYTLLKDSAITPKSAILLTDGYQNSGTDPLSVPPTYPIFACAMGPNSDQGLLQKIASRTGGTYYYMPYPINMMQIFNQMRALQPKTQNITNYLGALSAAQPSQLLPVVFSNTSQLQQVGVVWDNTSYVYANNPNPGSNQIYVALYQPNGQIYSAAPTIIGSGYVVFNVPSPTPGSWNVYIQYQGSSTSVYATTGAFEFADNPQDTIRLDLSTPATVKAGTPLQVNARVYHGDQALQVDAMHAEIISPVISVSNALLKYADELKSISSAVAASDDDVSQLGKLRALRNLHLPTHDILPHRTVCAPLTPASDGSHQLLVNDTLQGGSYNVIVRVTGYSEVSKTPFQRTQLATILVED